MHTYILLCSYQISMVGTINFSIFQMKLLKYSNLPRVTELGYCQLVCLPNSCLSNYTSQWWDWAPQEYS